jgi:outer membrane protein assembly factor BamE (lipoprotein component of BamABCDE complex)
MNRKSFGILLAAAIAGCSGGGGSAASPSAADSLLVKWCEAKPGITREQLLSIMGKPTSEPPMQLSWTAQQSHYTAFFDADGTVKQLDFTSYAPTAEKPALSCAETRTRKSMLAAQAVPAPARIMLDACTLVSATEMSAILGAPVLAKATSRSKCIYKPANEISPYAEFSVDWGDGRIAMKGVGMTEEHEPGITSPYDGLGDQAVAVGPALMIRTGEDLVTIVFSGVSDTPAAAKRIFDTAKAKM